MSPPNAPIVGVTGPLAAGKSTVSRRLGELGAHVIDVDALGHEALATDDAKKAVVEEFGRGVLSGDGGTLDRRALARIAFETESARRRLEAIVHPIVRRRIDEEIARARSKRAPAIVIDCALLFESGLDALCDATIDVDAPETVRLARARAAHGWTADEVRRRSAAQLAPEEKRARADRAIVNDGDAARLETETRALWERVLRGDLAAARRTSS